MSSAAAFAIEPGQAAGAVCAPIQQREVEALFERWNQALASGQSETVTALYGEGALLLPTLSADSRTSPEAINAYFRQFLARSPQGEVTSRQILLGCNQAIDAGTYRFSLHNPDAVVEARYTFVYGFDGAQWRILHHHSSLVPS